MVDRYSLETFTTNDRVARRSKNRSSTRLWSPPQFSRGRQM